MYSRFTCSAVTGGGGGRERERERERSQPVVFKFNFIFGFGFSLFAKNKKQKKKLSKVLRIKTNHSLTLSFEACFCLKKTHTSTTN